MIVLHIGAPKTASTLVQTVLHDFRHALAGIGITVPSSGLRRDGGHVGFRETLRSGSGGDPELAALRRDYTRAFASEQAIVLSCEQLWTVPPEHVLRIYPGLAGARIVFYARWQPDMILSHFFQKVSGAGESRSLVRFAEEERHQYDFHLVATQWEKAFGSGSVLPRVFEHNPGHHGIAIDALLGFAEALRLDEDARARIAALPIDPKQRANARGHDFPNLLRLFANRNLDEASAADVMDAAMRDPALCDGLDIERLPLTSGFERALVERYDVSNRRFAAEFLSRTGFGIDAWAGRKGSPAS